MKMLHLPNIKPLLRITIFLGYFFLIINSALFLRDIWIDEFLHFALGSSQSLPEAINITINSIGNVNHGQTGTYMIIDFLLLKIFGASSIVLRLPSAIAAGFMFYAGNLIIQYKSNNSYYAKILLLLIFAGSPTLLSFVGEARPYMPLAASGLLLLAFYVINPREISSFQRELLYLSGVFFGSLFHPYFPVYWLIAVLIGYVDALTKNNIKASIKGLIQFSNPIRISIGAIIYIAIASVTWLFQPTSFTFDPFQWIPKNQYLEIFSVFHFQFATGMFLVLTLLIFLLILIFSTSSNLKLFKISAPALLMVFACVGSLIISYISYTRSYWILPRQWVGSLALIPVSYVWLLTCITNTRSKLIINITMCTFIALTFNQAASTQMSLLNQNLTIFKNQLVATPSTCENHDVEISTEIEEGNKAWVLLANKNISCGGSVWPIFRRYYQGHL